MGDKSEDFSPSSKRETSAQSPDGEDESYAEGSEEVGVDKVGKEASGSDGGNDGDEEDDGEESCEGTSVGPRDNRPFILLTEWAVNKFLPLISDKVFKELRIKYQIPEHIPISVSLGRTEDVTRRGQLTSVCTTPCLPPGLNFR